MSKIREQLSEHLEFVRESKGKDDILTVLRRIVDNHQYEKFKFENGKTSMIDATTANMLVQAYDKVSDKGKANIVRLAGKSPAGIATLMGILLKSEDIDHTEEEFIFEDVDYDEEKLDEIRSLDEDTKKKLSRKEIAAAQIVGKPFVDQYGDHTKFDNVVVSKSKSKVVMVSKSSTGLAISEFKVSGGNSDANTVIDIDKAGIKALLNYIK